MFVLAISNIKCPILFKYSEDGVDKTSEDSSSGLSKEEVERMKKEAEAHAEEDKKKKEEVELVNQADAVIFTTEKMLKESGDKMKAEDKTELEAKVAELKKAKEANDLVAIKKSLEDVNTVAQKIGAAMYQAASPEAGATGTNPEATTEEKKDEVVEGEVEEKK